MFLFVTFIPPNMLQLTSEWTRIKGRPARSSSPHVTAQVETDMRSASQPHRAVGSCADFTSFSEKNPEGSARPARTGVYGENHHWATDWEHAASFSKERRKFALLNIQRSCWIYRLVIYNLNVCALFLRLFFGCFTTENVYFFCFILRFTTIRSFFKPDENFFLHASKEFCLNHFFAPAFSWYVFSWVL